MKTKKLSRKTINNQRKKKYNENISVTEKELINEPLDEQKTKLNEKKEKKKHEMRNLRSNENYKKIERIENRQRIMNLRNTRNFQKKEILLTQKTKKKVKKK